MMYTLNQYNTLHLHQKTVVLEDDAVFLMNLSKKGIIYSLYAYFSFYVEVIIEKDSQKLVDIVAFKDPLGLDKYMENIVLIGF